MECGEVEGEEEGTLSGVESVIVASSGIPFRFFSFYGVVNGMRSSKCQRRVESARCHDPSRVSSLDGSCLELERRDGEGGEMSFVLWRKIGQSVGNLRGGAGSGSEGGSP